MDHFCGGRPTPDAAAIDVMRPKAARQVDKQAKAVMNGKGRGGKASGKGRLEKVEPEGRETREAGLRVRSRMPI